MAGDGSLNHHVEPGSLRPGRPAGTDTLGLAVPWGGSQLNGSASRGQSRSAELLKGCASQGNAEVPQDPAKTQPERKALPAGTESAGVERLQQQNACGYEAHTVSVLTAT